MTFNEFARELNGDKVEGELLRTVFYSLLTGFATLIVLYYLKLRYIDNFMSDYGFFIFLAVLSYAIITPAIRQVRAHKELPCMSGMMVGMTLGMIAGFLPGFFLASTNGMFIGSVFGIAIGMAIGVWNGKCCGVMGSMEGLMAGFMGGLMGAMTAFMLLNDHLRTTAVIVFAVCALISIKLNYMIYRETREMPRQIVEDHFFTIALTFVLTAVTTWLMVFGPKTGLFGA